MEPSRVLEKVLEERRPTRPVSKRTATEGIVGLAASVLSIIGLSGVLPIPMLAIATIALGAAMVIEAGAVINRFYYAMQETGEEEYVALPGGTSIETLAGIAGVALGILALLGLTPAVLCSIALISFGASMVFGAGMISMIDTFLNSRSVTSASARTLSNTVTSASADMRTMAGLGAVVLGVIGVIGINTVMLSFIGLLSIGAALFFETVSLTATISSFTRK